MVSEYSIVFSRLLDFSEEYSFSKAKLIKNAKRQCISILCHCWLLEHGLTRTMDFEDAVIESIWSLGKKILAFCNLTLSLAVTNIGP